MNPYFALSMKNILQAIKKFAIRFGLVLLLALALTIVFGYFVNYSNGERAGKIVKLSHKGIIIKTWECQMNMQALSMEGTPTQWEFSIPHARKKEMLAKIREAMQEDAQVIIYYEEKLLRLFWEGDTKYWITKIEINPNKD